MKKYISIVTLLAAGTVAANAAELIAGWDFNNAVVDSNGITSFAATSGNTSYTLTGVASAAASQASSLTQSGWASDITAGGAASTGSSWFKNTDSIFSNIATEGTAFTIMLWVNVPVGDNVPILSTGSNNNWGDGFKWGVHENKTLFTTKSVADYTKSTSTVSVNTWTHLAISIKAKASGFDVSYFVNGNAAGTASDDRAMKAVSDSLKSEFYLGAKGAEGDNLDNYYFDELKIYSGTMDASAVAAEMVNISTIPEPSAFGLLAGLGALALVGMRRRRK